MPSEDRRRDVVERLFQAMQVGPEGESRMMELFADDAVFIEPFSGEPRTHSGKDAIRASFREMWADPAPEMKLVLDRVDLQPGVVRAEWTCSSPVFPSPMRGYDLFTIDSGKITRLEIVVTDMPAMSQ